MLTHVHKVIHSVVGTFEQGLGTSPVECPPVECRQSDSATDTLYRKERVSQSVMDVSGGLTQVNGSRYK